MKGKWRITNMPGYTSDFPYMMEPAYVLFDGQGSGEFAFGRVTSAIYAADDAQASSVEFSRNGNDEMDAACGEGWAEIQPDGFMKGQISFLSGDKADFTAQPWNIFSEPC